MRIRFAFTILLGAVVFVASANAISTDDEWTLLRTALHLPTISPGAACPVSPVDRRVNWSRINTFGMGTGSGPVYPGVGGHKGLIFASRSQYGGPWLSQKVFWYAKPAYRGPILIRGARLDGPELMGFNGGTVPDQELRIAPGQTVRWQRQPPGSRGIPSGVRVAAAGCYGFQIDGTGFSRVVVVTVDLQH